MATKGIIGYSNKSSYIIYCRYCINLFRICTKLFCAIERVEKCSNSIYLFFLLSWSYKPFSFLRVVGWWLPASGYNKLYQSSVAYLRRHCKHSRHSWSVVEQHFRFSYISYWIYFYLVHHHLQQGTKVGRSYLSTLSKSVQSITFIISYSIS